MTDDILPEVEKTEESNDVSQPLAKLLPIVLFPDENLRKISMPVESFDDELIQLIKDMFYTMRAMDGIGLAAPQVGVLKRVIVMNLESPVIMVNPKIIAEEGTQEFEEGCLSLPNTFGTITRAERIRVAYQNEEGTHMDMEATGLSAVCIQHEIDHLNGKVFIEHLSSFKKMRAHRRAVKIKNKIEKGLM